MKYTLFCIAFICSLCCYNSNSYAQERPTVPSSVNTVEDKVYALSLLWSEIKYNFVHIDQVNFDIDSLYRATMRRVLKTENDQDFYKEIDRFLVKFKDGHTELVIRPESGEENTDYPRYGTALFGDKFYFTSYRLHSDTDSLLLGAEIVEIEGIPTTEYVEKYVLPDITGSTPTYNLKVAGALLLNGKVHTRIKGKALTRAGKIVNFDVIRDGESTRTPDEQWWEPKSERKRNWRDKIALNWENDIAIVSIDKFWPEEEMCHKIDSIMQIVRKENPAGLVIDLRNNGGGSTNVAQHLQMYLTDADSLRTFGWQTRKTWVTDGRREITAKNTKIISNTPHTKHIRRRSMSGTRQSSRSRVLSLSLWEPIRSQLAKTFWFASARCPDIRCLSEKKQQAQPELRW